MLIKFTDYIYPEEFDFSRIIRNAGYAHDVDADDVTAKIWNGGTRELAIGLVLDTETGIITVDKDAN